MPTIKPERADYILYISASSPVAIVEAKDNSHSVSHGPQQAMEYAQKQKLSVWEDTFLKEWTTFFYSPTSHRTKVHRRQAGRTPALVRQIEMMCLL